MQLYFEKHDSHIERAASSSAMRTLLLLWNSACMDREMPDYTMLNVGTIPHLAARTLVAIPTRDDDYQWVFVGPEVAEDVTMPMTGVSIRNLGERLGPFLADCFDQVTKSKKPLYTIHHSELVNSVHTWENLILPIRMIDGTISLMMYNAALEYHQNLLESVLETMHEGIISMRAVRDDDRHIIDATIISANSAAETMLGTPLTNLVGKRLSDVEPGLWKSDRWRKYVEVIETGESHAYQTTVAVDGSARQIRFNINKLDDGMTATLTDITHFIDANEKLERKHEELLAANDALKQQARELAALAESLENTHQELNREISHRRALEIQLRRQAETDPLTGIANRRRILERGAAEILRARRYGRRLSTLMIDIDHFKAINDTYGHAAGDVAILSVAELCRSTVRDGADLVGRLGGEEFALLLPETDRKQALALAERLRAKCEELTIEHEGRRFSLTVSIGVATIGDPDTDIMALIDRADKALYRAKHEGRNRVTCLAA